jgi:hypothetical protein
MLKKKDRNGKYIQKERGKNCVCVRESERGGRERE